MYYLFVFAWCIFISILIYTCFRLIINNLRSRLNLKGEDKFKRKEDIFFKKLSRFFDLANRVYTLSDICNLEVSYLIVDIHKTYDIPIFDINKLGWNRKVLYITDMNYEFFNFVTQYINDLSLLRYKNLGKSTEYVDSMTHECVMFGSILLVFRIFARRNEENKRLLLAARYKNPNSQLSQIPFDMFKLIFGLSVYKNIWNHWISIADEADKFYRDKSCHSHQEYNENLGEIYYQTLRECIGV